YSWWVPAGSGSNGSGGGPPNPSWPEALAPNVVLPANPSFDSQYVSVSANSGALDVTLPMPSYNPNIPAFALTYDSLTADPRPIVVEHHTLDATQTIPTKVSGQLTLNGTA